MKKEVMLKKIIVRIIIKKYRAIGKLKNVVSIKLGWQLQLAKFIIDLFKIKTTTSNYKFFLQNVTGGPLRIKEIKLD